MFLEKDSSFPAKHAVQLHASGARRAVIGLNQRFLDQKVDFFQGHQCQKYVSDMTQCCLKAAANGKNDCGDEIAHRVMVGESGRVSI